MNAVHLPAYLTHGRLNWIIANEAILLKFAALGWTMSGAGGLHWIGCPIGYKVLGRMCRKPRHSGNTMLTNRIPASGGGARSAQW